MYAVEFQTTIKNGTIETTLNFEKDGIKSAPGAVVPPRTALVPPLTLPAVRPGIPGFGSTLTNLATPNPAIANRSVTVTGGAGTPGAGRFLRMNSRDFDQRRHRRPEFHPRLHRQPGAVRRP